MAQNMGVRSPVTSVVLGALSHVGQKRANNQDSMCSIAAPNTPTGVTALVAVADGMGGHKSGEVASALAIEGVVTRLGKNSALDRRIGNSPETMVNIVRQIHSDVLAAGNTPETSGMGTTLSIAVLENGRMLLGHVGDSRVYRLRAGQFSQLTRDHSWVAEEVVPTTESQRSLQPYFSLMSS